MLIMYSVIFHRRQNKYQFQKLVRFSQGNHDINIKIRIIGFSGIGGGRVWKLELESEKSV